MMHHLAGQVIQEQTLSSASSWACLSPSPPYNIEDVRKEEGGASFPYFDQTGFIAWCDSRIRQRFPRPSSILEGREGGGVSPTKQDTKQPQCTACASAPVLEVEA